MSQFNIADRLDKHWLFEDRSKSELAMIADKLNTITYPKNSYIFHEHDESDKLYIIIDGEISIETVSIDGKSTVFANLLSGEVFGEFAAIDSGIRSASARVIRNSVISSMSGDIFKSIIRDFPDMGLKMASVLVSRLRDTNRKLQSVNTETLPHRLVSMMVQLCKDIETTDIITIKLTQKVLADRLSASREKVNKHLQVLQSRDLIRIKRGQLQILNLDRLKSLIQWGQ